MAIAVDFSEARPTIAQLKAAGVAIVIRYLTGSNGKAITPLELSEYLLNGFVVVFVFEVGANDAQGGYPAGAANALSAQAAMAALKIQAPIYFAVDQDIAPASALNYFHGVNAVRQPSLVGVYGEGALCSLLQTEGLATWFWQSESTSFPGNATTLPITHLQQKFNASPVPGTDLDVICKPDVGQYPRPSAPTPHDPTPQPVPVPAPSAPTQEEEMPLYATDSKGTGWVIATDLSSRTGIPDAADAAALLATNLYHQVKLDDALIDAIPVT